MFASSFFSGYLRTDVLPVDGSLLATTCNDRQVRIWEVDEIFLKSIQMCDNLLHIKWNDIREWFGLFLGCENKESDQRVTGKICCQLDCNRCDEMVCNNELHYFIYISLRC